MKQGCHKKGARQKQETVGQQMHCTIRVSLDLLEHQPTNQKKKAHPSFLALVRPVLLVPRPHHVGISLEGEVLSKQRKQQHNADRTGLEPGTRDAMPARPAVSCP